MKTLLIAVSIALLYAAVTANAAPVEVNFNTPGDLTDNFQQNGDPNPCYTQVDSGGIGGSGAVDLPNLNDKTAVYTGTSYDFTGEGTILTISQYVKIQTAINSNGVAMQLGFINNDDVGFSTPSGDYGYTSLILHDVSGFGYRLRVRYKPLTEAQTSVFVADETTLTNGNWYKLTANFERLSGTGIRVTGNLEDYGSDGTGFQSTTMTVTPYEFSLSDIANDGSVYGGFRGFYNYGADLYDNFYMVPEPATMALLGLGSLALLRRRRRA